MKELPIPFTAAMVRAVREGRKTQTRRLRMLCRPGDRLWVREAWRALAVFDKVPPREIPPGNVIWYEADGPLGAGGTHEGGPTSWGKLRPPMFMPRWMSRTMLDVTEVRGHQLQIITLAEAIAEGVHPDPSLRGDDDMMVHNVMLVGARDGEFLMPAPLARFVVLWDSINGKKRGVTNWTANPFVWAHSFKVTP